MDTEQFLKEWTSKNRAPKNKNNRIYPKLDLSLFDIVDDMDTTVMINKDKEYRDKSLAEKLKFLKDKKLLSANDLIELKLNQLDL